MYMCRSLEPDFSWDDLYVTGDVLENEGISPFFCLVVLMLPSYFSV